MCKMLPPDHNRNAALDYGSGTGRLSFALAARFERVTAADISRSMIGVLESRAADRGLTNISTVDLNETSPGPDHDVAFSLITLQHFQTLENVSGALEKIARALRPGGYAIVDFPTPPASMRRRVQPRYQAHRALKALKMPSTFLDRIGLSGISMLYEAPNHFEERLSNAGLKPLEHEFYSSEYSKMATYLTKRSPGASA